MTEQETREERFLKALRSLQTSAIQTAESITCKVDRFTASDDEAKIANDAAYHYRAAAAKLRIITDAFDFRTRMSGTSETN